MLDLSTIKDIIRGNDTNVEPVSGFKMIDSYAVYDEESSDSPSKRKLKYLCYEIESVNPESGERLHFYKALKFARVLRLPKAAKESKSFMDIQQQILAAVYQNNYNMVTIVANIIKPEPIGLLFLYGVQGVAHTIEEAKEKADHDFIGLTTSFQGSFRVLEMTTLVAKEAEWLREKMHGMQYMTVVRGVPKANKSGEDAGNKGIGGRNLNPDSQGTLEEFIAGMADYEYVLQVLSTPVYRRTLQEWAMQTAKNMSDWNSQLQGTKALSFNISVPMMYVANQSSSQGWSKAYGNAQSVSYNTGTSTSNSFSESVSHGLSESFSKSYGLTKGQSLTESVSNSHSVSAGTTFGQSIGQNVGTSVNQGASTNISNGQSISRSMTENTGVSNGESFNQTVSHGFGESASTSHSLGQSQNVSDGVSENVGQSVNQSQGFSQSSGGSESVNRGGSSSESSSLSFGQSVSSNTGVNYGTQGSRSLSVNGGQSSGSNFGGNGGIFGFGINGGSSDGTSVSGGMSASQGISTSASHSVGEGASTSQGTSLSQSNSWGASEGSSWSTGNSQSIGNSVTHGQSASHSDSFGTSESFGVSNGRTSNESFGVSAGSTQSISMSKGLSEGWGTSISESSGVTSSQGYSSGQSASQSLSQSETVSNGVTTGKSVGTSLSESNTEGTSHGTTETTGQSTGLTQGTSEGRGTSTSENISQGTSGAYVTGASSSMGFGPSVGYNKSYQWMDQQVKDILELLEYQNERLKKSLRGEGAFYTYVYIACPSKDALAAASAVAKSTWQNEYAMVNPINILNLSKDEQKLMLTHFQSFSSNVTKERIGGVSQYKYATVLLPQEYVAYTHLPRISEGGIFADVNDVPKFAVVSQLQGEIYMGTQLSAERYTMQNGYRTQFDFRIDESELMHGFFTGASRSGKTVAAMRFVAELANIRRKKTGKRLRIVCMDPKQDWRTLARYIDPDRFRFYSLGNCAFRPVKINPFKIPRGVVPQTWIDGVIDIYCRAYGLLERGKQMMGETIYSLYEEAGVFEACEKPDWKDTVPELSKNVNFINVYKKMSNIKASLEDPTNPKGRAGNDTRDAYARLLDRLQCFSRPFSVESKLFGTSDGIGIDEMIGDDDVTVLESSGLEKTFKNFIFGVITSGFYKFAKAHEGGFLAEDQYETMLVIEEANEVLIGNDAAGSGSGSSNGMTVSGPSEFEEILDQSAGYGLFIVAITQKIADMPKSVIANSGLVFSGRLKTADDITVVIRSVAREERYDDRDLVKWFPRMPTGWFVCQRSRTFDFKDSEPILVQIARLNISTPSNFEIDEILSNRDANKTVRQFTA